MQPLKQIKLTKHLALLLTLAFTALSSLTATAAAATTTLAPSQIPGAPQNLVCIPGLGRALCSFEPPLNLGMPVLTDYVLTCLNKNNNSGMIDFYEQVGPASPILIALPVENEKSVSCSVIAHNNIGSSPLSNIVFVTLFLSTLPQTVPSRPQNLACVLGVMQVQCDFKPPSNLGVPLLTDYVLTCTYANTNDGFSDLNFAGKTSPITVPISTTGLPMGQELRCRVSAFNSVGLSLPSFLSRFTVPTSLSLHGGIDTNSDGKGELLVRRPGLGKLDGSVVPSVSYIGRLDTALNQIVFQPTIDAGPDWLVLGAGDFGGRGTSDLAIQNFINGEVKFWKGFSFAPENERIIRNVKPGWQVEAIADIDGDGKSDIVWRFYSTPANPSPNPDDNGVVFVWFMNDGVISKVKHHGGAPTNWRLFGAADLGGNGQANLVWISPQNTIRSITPKRGIPPKPRRTFVNELIGTIPTGYQLARLGDFNGDGKSDLLFSNNQGKTKLWIMDGITIQQSIDLPDTDPTWSLFAVADLNGDGTVDLVFRKPDNSLVVWLMNAATPAMPAVINNAGVLPLGVENIDPVCTGSCT